MQLRTFDQGYENQIVDLWNRSLTADQLTISKFRKQALFDQNFDSELCYVAIEEDRVVGFLLATKRVFPYLERGLEPDRGWINVVFVDSAYRGRHIGTQLMNRAERDLTSRGATNITFGAYSPNYFFPGVDTQNYPGADSFFEKLGYSRGDECYSMSKDLHGYVLPPSTQHAFASATQAGYTFAHFSYADSLELLEFLKQEFGGGWKRNALISMENDLAEDCILLARDKHGSIIGFCMRMIDGNPMRFGPIGVRADARNDGIGGILLDLMCEDMSRLGIYHMYFVSTDTPGRRFYERHDLQVFRTFIDYRKQLSKDEV